MRRAKRLIHLPQEDPEAPATVLAVEDLVVVLPDDICDKERRRGSSASNDGRRKKNAYSRVVDKVSEPSWAWFDADEGLRAESR